MNDSTQVSISAFCLCCARLYMRKVKDFQAAKNSVDNREACPRCAHEVQSLMAWGRCESSDWHAVNRLL